MTLHYSVQRILSLAAITFCAGVSAQDNNVQVNGTDDTVAVSYAGDDLRIGIGIDDDGDIHGEYFNVFGEDEDSNWIGEMWLSESRGGLKASYHWLTNNATLETANDETRVGKAFLAVDQNEHDDRKVTIGLGLESQRLFWGAYFMHSITGQRLVDALSMTTTDVLTGIDNGQNFTQNQFTTVNTNIFEEGYDYGLGFRIGHYYDNALIRLRGGLDYELGDRDADQLTYSLGVEKFFENTGHSLDLLVEHYDKDGQFEIDDGDTRATLYYRYAFGNSYKPRNRVVQTQVESLVDPIRNPVYVKNRATISREALFDLDEFYIRPDAAGTLQEVIRYIESHEVVEGIEVIGHTCDIASDAYNLTLSKNRANSVAEYLRDNGLANIEITTTGMGESQPKYDNSNPATQPLNRRVEIEFISLQTDDVVEFVCPDTTTPVDGGEQCKSVVWEQEVVPNPVWIHRALRNPVEHKRIVDTYRTVETDTTVTLGDRVITNTFPGAGDDSAITNVDTPVLINLLANDSDPDNDSLTITSITAPANGSVSDNGDGSVVYTPNAGFFGSDVFGYSIDDGNGGSAAATVTVTVLEQPPIQAVDDAITTQRNTPITIDTGDLLANDQIDVNFNFSVATQPVNGQLSGGSVGADVSLTYTPNRDFVGTDSFTYTVSNDSGQSSTATVTITVEAFNRAPIANDDDATTAKDTNVIIDVLANDSDPDGDSLTIIDVTQMTEFGSAEITADGRILYIPMPGWWGGDELTYTIDDGFGGQASATITLFVRER